jgi:hypothetical protein
LGFDRLSALVGKVAQRMIRKKYLFAFFVFGFLAMVAVLAYAAVRHQISDEDRQALKSVLGEDWIGMNLADSSFESQVRHVRWLQEESHERMHMAKAMPYDIHRSASNVLDFGGEWCYDFSYWYEEALRVAGLKTRHAALYQDLGGFAKTIATSQGLSHANTEVKTAKGWMLVEPTINKIWLDALGMPLSAKAVEEQVADGSLRLDESELALLYPLYKNPYFVVYGLYSRHGHCYKPFNRVLALHWGEFMANW